MAWLYKFNHRKMYEFEGEIIPEGQKYYRCKRLKNKCAFPRISDGKVFMRKDEEATSLSADEGEESSFEVWYKDRNIKDAAEKFILHYEDMISELEKKIQEYQENISYLKEL